MYLERVRHSACLTLQRRRGIVGLSLSGDGFGFQLAAPKFTVSRMILDQIDRRGLYSYGAAWDVAFEFLLSLDADAEEKRYALKGDEIYAAIESYATQLPSTKLPEAHRKYVDIQVLLSGVERIAWWPAAGLTVSKPYRAAADIAFFDRPDPLGTTVDLVPGRFAVFFPSDAHMPGLQIHSSSCVKKVVVKIDTRLLPCCSASAPE